MAEYMTTQEVAELLRTSAETVRFWRHARKGPPSFKVGRRVLYDAEQVRAWISAAQIANRSPVALPVAAVGGAE